MDRSFATAHMRQEMSGLKSGELYLTVSKSGGEGRF